MMNTNDNLIVFGILTRKRRLRKCSWLLLLPCVGLVVLYSITSKPDLDSDVITENRIAPRAFNSSQLVNKLRINDNPELSLRFAEPVVTDNKSMKVEHYQQNNKNASKVLNHGSKQKPRGQVLRNFKIDRRNVIVNKKRTQDLSNFRQKQRIKRIKTINNRQHEPSKRRDTSDESDILPLYSKTKRINAHNFDFIINNSRVCEELNTDVYLVMLVLSTHEEKENRDAIRKFWGGTRNVNGKTVITMFLLGIADNPDLETKLVLENKRHKDIIQESFVDTYNNLTLKTIMGFKWVSLFCPQTKYVMKVDGRDVTVILENIVERLAKAPATGFAEGNRFRNEKPIRKSDSKWYTSYDLFPETTYPPYLEGPAYIMSFDVASKIYTFSEFVRYLPWEDAYCGLVMKLLGVTPLQGWYFDVGYFYTDDTNQNECGMLLAISVKFSQYDLHVHGYLTLSEEIRKLVDTHYTRCHDNIRN